MSHKIVGGLRLLGDETGDNFRVFTEKLAALASGAVDFRYGVSVDAIVLEGGRVTAVRTADGLLPADAVVVAAGSW